MATPDRKEQDDLENLTPSVGADDAGSVRGGATTAADGSVAPSPIPTDLVSNVSGTYDLKLQKKV